MLLNPLLFLIGLFCGWLFYQTHSLIPFILVHLLTLLSGIICIVWARPQSFEQLLIRKNMIGNNALYDCLGVVSLLLTIFLLWRLKKTLDQQKPVTEVSLE